MAGASFISDGIGAYLNRQLAEQTWYQKNANTVTTAAGFLLTVAAWAASQPFGASEPIQFAVWAVGFLATIVGVKNTRNGWSASQIEKLRLAQNDVVAEVPLIPAPENHAPLGQLVEAFNTMRNSN